MRVGVFGTPKGQQINQPRDLSNPQGANRQKTPRQKRRGRERGLADDLYVNVEGDEMTGPLVIATEEDETALTIQMVAGQTASPVQITDEDGTVLYDFGDDGSIVARPHDTGSPAFSGWGAGSSASTTAYAFRGRGSRGTRDSPAAIQSSDYLAEFTGGGQYDTTEGHVHNVAASIRARAAENFDSTHAGTFLELLATPLASTTIAAMARLYATGLKIQNGVSAAPDATALLELSSTTQGLLIPRMTTTEKGNISSPPDGLIVYDTDIDAQCVRANGAWVTLGAASSARSGTDSPAQITSDQNNYSIGSSRYQRLSTNASRTITGIVATTGGDEIVIMNVGSQNLLLANENASSTAANRILFATGAVSLTLGENKAATLVYDGTSSRWRITSTTGV